MSLRQSYAAVLRLLRVNRGMTQQDLSGSVTQANISSLELAKSSATVETSAKLAEALNVEPLTLLALVIASNGIDRPEKPCRRLWMNWIRWGLVTALFHPLPSPTNLPGSLKRYESCRLFRISSPVGSPRLRLQESWRCQRARYDVSGIDRWKAEGGRHKLAY